MAEHKIKAVSPKTRTYESKFGEMIEYKILFEGTPQAVALSQKLDTPAPEPGQTLSGTIDMSGQYGPKFKKEYGGGGGFQRSAQSAGGGGPKKFNDDPFTMYLSYAKDLVVALVESPDGFKQEEYEKLLQAVIKGGKSLYGHRPGATPNKPETKPDKPATGDQADFLSLVESGEGDILEGEQDPWAND